MNKVILFTDKPKTPLLYRGISSYFYDKIKFGEVSISNSKLIRRFKVVTFPTILIYQTHDEMVQLHAPIIHKYRGRPDASEVGRFILNFTIREPFYQIEEKVKNNRNYLADSLDELDFDNKIFDRKMQQYSKKNVILHFYGKNNTNEHINKLVRETKYSHNIEVSLFMQE